MSRRAFLWQIGGGLGGLALTRLLTGDAVAEPRPEFNGGLHHPAKVKRIIQLFMPGIPQVWYLDLFAGTNNYEAADRGGTGGHKEINRTTLEPGDIEEGLRAASAIGDDMIQRRTTGRVVPEAFTHGSSEQRVRWFRKGYQSGRMQDCDTFNQRNL